MPTAGAAESPRTTTARRSRAAADFRDGHANVLGRRRQRDQGDKLQITSPNSDPYKQFLNKFVKMETQIEELQQQMREAQTALEKKTKEYDDYVKALTAG